MIDEQQLISAAQAGDREAFSELVCRYQASLRALAALSMLGPDDVADVVQEAFLHAYRHLGDFENGRPFGPWLRTICRNLLRNFLRDRAVRHRREMAGIDDLLPAPDPEETGAAAMARISALRACLDGLDERKRSVLAMRFLEGRAVKEIAGLLGLSANHVSVQIFQLKAVLLRCVTDRERQAGPA